MNRSSLIGIAALLLSACAGDPGTRPHDASAADHNAMAQQEDRAAEAHSGEAKSAGTDSNLDNRSTAKGGSPCGRGGCWTSSVNPTERNKEDAQRHRELAAKHRAASAALVTAEQQACEGLSEDDRDISPFYHREDISSVSVLEESVRTGKAAVKKTTGAKIEFRASEGMTAEWLQRVVECHIARAASMGHSMPEMDYCPLVPKGVKATVTSTGAGFAVNVTSDDPATVKEIVRRAEALKQ
jgi:hypothetical protein